ncbi:MAG TPA: hypothetical protein PLA68_08190, partial [Panacibacter sp.]|nr:hypothetical protein [Panacibacter sp.]
WKLVKDHELHPSLCFLDKTVVSDDGYPEKNDYNVRVQNALADMQNQGGTYAIFEPADFGKKYSCVLVENGRFYGMGLLPENTNFTNVSKLKERLTVYPENETVKSMIRSYAHKHPSKLLMMND